MAKMEELLYTQCKIVYFKFKAAQTFEGFCALQYHMMMLRHRLCRVPKTSFNHIFAEHI